MRNVPRSVAVLSICCAVSSCSRPLHRPTPRALPAAVAHRTWQDETVFVVVVGKFFNGDKANDIMARRFASQRSKLKEGYWGGDLSGVLEKLDYIQSLGATAILLYPVMANDRGAYGDYLTSGYRPRDYYQVDENFGDFDTLKRLIDGAHRRKMRVILDLPLGMPGAEHPYLQDATKRDWFGALTPYGLPRWNADNPHVADYLIQVSKFWKNKTGCDGFRLDSAHLHSPRFWAAYTAAIKSGSKDFVLLAELPLVPQQIEKIRVAAGFDSAYDFSVMTAREVFGRGESVGKFSFFFAGGDRRYSTPRNLCGQIDNYESPTFAATSLEPKAQRMKLGLTLLLTLDRVPLIYCGDEVGIASKEVGATFEPTPQSASLLQYTRQLVALRNREEVLRRGDFIELRNTDPVYAFARVEGKSTMVVILNNSPQPQSVRFKIGGRPWRGVALQDALTQQQAKAPDRDEPLHIEPFTARILKVGD